MGSATAGSKKLKRILNTPIQMYTIARMLPKPQQCSGPLFPQGFPRICPAADSSHFERVSIRASCEVRGNFQPVPLALIGRPATQSFCSIIDFKTSIVLCVLLTVVLFLVPRLYSFGRKDQWRYWQVSCRPEWFPACNLP